jgi:hypothetical protein
LARLVVCPLEWTPGREQAPFFSALGPGEEVAEDFLSLADQVSIKLPTVPDRELLDRSAGRITRFHPFEGGLGRPQQESGLLFFSRALSAPAQARKPETGGHQEQSRAGKHS